MEMPQIKQLGKTNNFAQVTVNGITVWFSYSTPVAFLVPGNKMVIRQNDWSNTTGKHLNQINTTLPRVTGEEFERLWKEQTEKGNL